MHKREPFALCARTSNPCLVDIRVHGFDIGTFASPTRRFIREAKKPPLGALIYEYPPPEHDKDNKFYGVIKASFRPIDEENLALYESLTGVSPVIDKYAPLLEAVTFVRVYMQLDDPRRFLRRRSTVSRETQR